MHSNGTYQIHFITLEVENLYVKIGELILFNLVIVLCLSPDPEPIDFRCVVVSYIFRN